MFLCFLCAFSSSLDTLAVSVSYGTKKIKVSFFIIFIISLISTIGTYFSMLFGKVILQYTGENIINFIGSLVLVFLGAFFIYETCVKVDVDFKEIINNPVVVDYNNSGKIDLNEALFLAVALTINNVGVGVASSIAGLNIFFTTFFTFIITITSFKLGIHLGQNYLSKNFSKAAQVTSGIIIILIGLFKIII